MDCPRCGSGMQRGRLAAWTGESTFGHDTAAQVDFVPADGSDETKLHGWQSSLALICIDCGILILDLHSAAPKIRTASDKLPDDRSEPAQCLSCQGTIPAGSDVCPICGWSYNMNESDST